MHAITSGRGGADVGCYCGCGVLAAEDLGRGGRHRGQPVKERRETSVGDSAGSIEIDHQEDVGGVAREVG